MSNRHIPNSIVEVWDSYEWLIRRKLEELDHLARQMYSDMTLTKAPKEQIEQLIPMAFAELWNNVVEIEKQRGEKRERASAV